MLKSHLQKLSRLMSYLLYGVQRTSRLVEILIFFRILTVVFLIETMAFIGFYQTDEYYKIYFSYGSGVQVIRSAIFAVGLSILVVCYASELWYLRRKRHQRENIDKSNAESQKVWRLADIPFPVDLRLLLVATPLIFLSCAMYKTIWPYSVVEFLSSCHLFFYLVMFLAMSAFVLRLTIVAQDKIQGLRRAFTNLGPAQTYILMIFMPILYAVMVIDLTKALTGIKSFDALRLDSLSILILFLSAVVVFLVPIMIIGDRFRFPAYTFILIYAFGISYLDLNDNHDLLLIEKKADIKAPPRAEEAFRAWLCKRKDLSIYNDEGRAFP
jgi:hypothetical protein